MGTISPVSPRKGNTMFITLEFGGTLISSTSQLLFSWSTLHCSTVISMYLDEHLLRISGRFKSVPKVQNYYTEGVWGGDPWSLSSEFSGVMANTLVKHELHIVRWVRHWLFSFNIISVKYCLLCTHPITDSALDNSQAVELMNLKVCSIL